MQLVQCKYFNIFLIIISFFLFIDNGYAYDYNNSWQYLADGYCNPSTDGVTQHTDSFKGLSKSGYLSISHSTTGNPGAGFSGAGAGISAPVIEPGVGNIRIIYAINGLKIDSDELKINGYAYVNTVTTIASNGAANQFCYNVIRNSNECSNKFSGHGPVYNNGRGCVQHIYGTFGERNVNYRFRLIKTDDNSVVEFDDSQISYVDSNNDLFYFQGLKEKSWTGIPYGSVNWYKSGSSLSNNFDNINNDRFSQTAHYRGGFEAKLDNLSNKLSPGEYKLQMQLSMYNIESSDRNKEMIFKTNGENSRVGDFVVDTNSNRENSWIDIGVFNDSSNNISHNDTSVITSIKNDGIEASAGNIKTASWSPSTNHVYWQMDGHSIKKTVIPLSGGSLYTSSTNKIRYYSAKELLDNGYYFDGAYGSMVDFYRVKVYGNNYVIPISWTDFNSKTTFVVKGDEISVPQEQDCKAEFGDDYEQVYKKEYYPIRRFKLSGGEGLAWKQLCELGQDERTVAEETTYTGAIDDIVGGITEPDKYDLSSIKAVRGETTIAKDEAGISDLIASSPTYNYLAGFGIYSSNFNKKNIMLLGFKGAPANGITLDFNSSGSNYNLKIHYIPVLKQESKYIDGNPICESTVSGPKVNLNTNTGSGDIYYPFKTEVKFCAKKKEVAVCSNTTNDMKCTETDNIKGEASYHESNEYNTCILKAQNDSGFKIVKANGKSTSDDTDMIEKDNIAQTGKESRYCVVACRDEVDFELPNLKEAFIGSKFELNLSRNGEEALTGPTINYKRYCVTSRIKEQAFKQDIKAQSLEVQKLYEEYRDLRYIWKHLEVESYNRTSSYHCTSYDPETGACTGGHYDCDYTWKIAQYGSIPNGSDGKLNATGEASLSTITNFTGQNGSYTGCPDSACSSSPWLDSSMDNSKPKIEAEFKKKMDDKWIEYEEAKEEQDLMAKEISNCYTWMKDDKLYNGTPEAPGIYYDYDDDASQYVRNPMKHKQVSIPGVPDEEFCYKDIYNDSHCDSGYTHSTISNYYADCYEEDDATEDRCYRAEGLNPSYTPLYNKNYFEIASSIHLTNAYDYVKRIETKKWKYEIDPLTNTVYTNKKGDYFNAADKNSLDEYPNGYNTKLTGYNVSPIAMKTIAKDGYNYTLKYSKLDDKTRKKYTSDVGDNELTLENKTTKYNVYNTNNSTYTCKYNVKADGSTTPPPGGPGVTPPGGPGTTPSGNHINFFYRTINVENINPTSRMLGYNWSEGANSSDVRSDLKDIIAETGDYQKLIGNTAKSGAGLADSKSDSITFRLTPALMEDIRKNYNGTHNYSNYTEMKCSDTDSKTKFYCESEFLECLTGQKLDGICNELDGTLLTDVADGGNLNNFRNIVKAKNEKYIN